MADPVSSVAYALQAALVQLDGDLAGLFGTMAIVIATITIVGAGYHLLIGRFPGGGGGAEALAAAFGEGWAFVPVGALLVDFTLTIAVSCSAAASALIAASPSLAPGRVPLALALAAIVAAGSAVGHRGRIAFAAATLAFVGLAVVVGGKGLAAGSAAGAPALLGGASLGAVVLAVPLGMALATGVEAPANAIAQLGQLDDRGRRRFGQGTIWIMLAIVGTLSLALAAAAVRLDVGLPPSDSTLLAEITRRAVGSGVLFQAFQAASALLLLAAAASSYLAGSGLLAALARHGADHQGGLLPRRLGRTNQWLVPWRGIVVLLAATAAVVLAAGGRDQEIVNFYAVAVFASFLGALAGGARLWLRERRWGAFAVSALGAAVVAGILVLNLGRLDSVISLAVAGAISLGLWGLWVARGRPGGVSAVVR